MQKKIDTQASSRSLFRRLMVIALPIIVQGLVVQVQTLVNRIFLGNSKVEYLSAIGNSLFPYFATMTVIVAASTGLIILVAQRIGAGRAEEAQDYVNSSIVYSSVLSVGLFVVWFFFSAGIFSVMGVSRSLIRDCVDYVRIISFTLIFAGIDISLQAALQGAGKTTPIMYSGIAKIALNVVLDWLLIFGHFGFPKLGIVGAALATAIATICSIAVLSIYTLSLKDLPFSLSISGIPRSARFELFKDMLKIGIPTAFESLAWFAGVLIFVRILNHLDAFAVGIYTIIFGIDIAVLGIYNGLARAALTLVGNKIGEANREEARRVLTMSLVYNLAFVSVTFLLFSCFPKPIIGLFTKDSAIVNRSVPFFLIMAATLFPKSMNVVVGSGIRGTGDTKWMLYTQLFGTAFVAVSAFLMAVTFKMGILGVYLAVLFDEIIRSILNTRHFYRRNVSAHAAPTLAFAPAETDRRQSTHAGAE